MSTTDEKASAMPSDAECNAIYLAVGERLADAAWQERCGPPLWRALIRAGVEWAQAQRADATPSAPQGDADGAKRAVSAILGKALRGSDGAYRTVDRYTRWGKVEDDIHAAIDAAIAKGQP